MSKHNWKRVTVWALYDWANSAYATTVMAGFFPLFFKQYWSATADVTVSTFQLGSANSCASLIVALFAPVLGAIADAGGVKKKFLFFFALMGIVMTGSLSLVAQGNCLTAIGIYILATIGFSAGNIFYDALIIDAAPTERIDFVSALGYALGYLGGGLLFLVNVAMIMKPQVFGLTDATEAVRVSFLCVALWWALFSIPIFLFLREAPPAQAIASRNIVKNGFRQILDTMREIRRLRVIGLFLLAYFMYIDGVHTVIRMAVDYGMSIGLKGQSLMVALLITQFVGFPAAILFGRIGERWGAKTGIFIGIGVYLFVTVWGSSMSTEKEFLILAITVGMVQGGVQALSRSFYTRIIPKFKAAEFFGFYNMLGKFAAIIGPFLMGWVSLLTGNARYSILSLGLLFVSGALILSLVDEKKGRLAALSLQ
ncbi:MAG: MFS transporter [Deltaproteobacteria bacterium]|nr:MFS transporter [Deltaproteobacteria bacterium]